MSTNSPLRVVQLTAAGRGAVATLRVEGTGAIDLVDDQFRARDGQSLVGIADDRLTVGRFGDEPGEEVVARCRRPLAVEIHCHGGHAAIRRIVESLVRRGCTAVAWQDWCREQHTDPITADAAVALADARTERTAAILLDQYSGALRGAFDLIDLAIIEGDRTTARDQIELLLGRADVGQHLVRPWRVALAGRPNAGKSTLINALVGYTRAIVHHLPGTTRDVVTADAAVDGWPVVLSDMAGLRTGGDTTEREGVRLARTTLYDADLVVLVFDGSTAWSEREQALFDAWPDGLIVHSKCDLPRADGRRPPGENASGLTSHGIDRLVRAIADRLVPRPPPPGVAVPFLDEHVEYLRRAAVRCIK